MSDHDSPGSLGAPHANRPHSQTCDLYPSSPVRPRFKGLFCTISFSLTPDAAVGTLLTMVVVL